MKRSNFLSIALLMLSIAFSLPLHSQGLRFTGLEKTIENRSSYDVFGGSSRNFKGNLTLDFQVYMYPEENARFGYFFRIRENGGNSGVWNLSYNAATDGKVTVRFNQEGSESLIKAILTTADIPELHWVNIKLNVDMVHGKAMLDIAGRHFEGPFHHSGQSLDASIIFGVSDYIIDVPSFAMRRLVVSDQSESVCFPFTEAGGNVVHDSERHAVGKVRNPGWMIGESSHWTRIHSCSLPNCAGAGFDEKTHRFYYYDKERIIYYNLLSGKQESHTYANPCPMNITPASSFIRDGHLVSYEPCGHLTSHKPAIAALDMKNLEWEVISDDGVGMQLFHHTGFIDPTDSSYCIFGGYGSMMYNGHFYTLDRFADHWSEKWAGRRIICPRYFVSSGTDQRNAYFFGGMGNASGEQVVGRKYFYDFYRVDLASGKDTLLWTLPAQQSNFVPVRNMVVDGEYAYTLCYPEYQSDSHLTLHRFRISDGEDVILDDTVPICSDKLFTNATLYLDRDLQKMFALTQTFTDDVASTLDIYSINYPVIFDPLTYEDIHNRKKMRVIAMLLMLLAVVVALVVILAVASRRRMDEDYRMNADKRNLRRSALDQHVPDTIHIFGEFQITDRNGRDISGLITGQQREILLLIIKYSLRGGISSERLSKIVWPDKEEDKVKNSRGVALNKLRSSLSAVNGISVLYENGCYKLETGSVAHCDFFDFEAIASQNEPDIEALLAIAARGKFVSFSESPIFDSWKARVEDKLSSMLHGRLQRAVETKDHMMVLDIADVLFTIDPLDEPALRASIHSLKALHQNEDARVRYSDFIAEWRQSNGDEYPVSYRSL